MTILFDSAVAIVIVLAIFLAVEAHRPVPLDGRQRRLPHLGPAPCRPTSPLARQNAEATDAAPPSAPAPSAPPKAPRSCARRAATARRNNRAAASPGPRDRSRPRHLRLLRRRGGSKLAGAARLFAQSSPRLLADVHRHVVTFDGLRLGRQCPQLKSNTLWPIAATVETRQNSVLTNFLSTYMGSQGSVIKTILNSFTSIAIVTLQNGNCLLMSNKNLDIQEPSGANVTKCQFHNVLKIQPLFLRSRQVLVVYEIG